ncbi:MAG: phosphatidylglycerophosphatase A [Acidobacteriota bacterium]|nr:MAG: phosphatidylglycerophosphatase A [Acidobacteriota bacterium]
MIRDKFNESRAKRGEKPVVEGPADGLAMAIATGFGAGLIPWGPGTWGSIVGLLIAYRLIDLFGNNPILLQNCLIATGIVTAAAGIWSGSRAEKIFNRKDPGQVVIDEVCGQILTFILIAPYLEAAGSSWRWWMIAGFALFRLCDIFKPYPINKLQDLEGGFGVMMDDVLAGIYAASALSLLMFLFN